MSQRPLTKTTDAAPMVATGDAAEALAVLSWAKANGVELSSVSVGTCSVKLARAAVQSRDEAPIDPRQALYKRFGGEMLAQTVRLAEDVPGEDMQPAVGRR